MKKFFCLLIFNIFFMYVMEASSYHFYKASTSSNLEDEVYLDIDYNNPFCPKNNEVTKIKYVVKNADLKVKIFIFSISGRFIKILVDDVALKDTIYSIDWDGRDQNGEILPEGLYIVTLLTGDNRSISKLVGIIHKR